MGEQPEGKQQHRDYANRYREFADQYRDYGERIREGVERGIGEHMREHAERRAARRHSRSCQGSAGGGLVIGGIIILIGVAMLLDNFGIIEARDYWQFWPAIFIVLGAAKVAEARAQGGGLVLGLGLIVAGTIWTLDNIGIIIFDPRLIWPLVIIGIGALFLVRSLERRRIVMDAPPPPNLPDDSTALPQPEAQIVSSDTVQQWTVFGGSKRAIDSQNFRGGQLFAMFGGVELDLRDAALPRTAVLDASAVFGGIEIRVPPTWIVEMRGSGIFGGYEDKTSHPRVERPGEAPRLIVTGAALFGGVSIKN
jgi:hypothetical protein